jgi:transposase InsO family protein
MLCSLLGYSRQSFYKRQESDEENVYQEAILLEKVQDIRETQPRIGGRKLHMTLRDFMHGHQMEMGRDRFFDFLASHHLLIRQKRRKKPITTTSYHWLKKYPNLIRDLVPERPNLLWVSDITYIEVSDKFCYLSLLTDAYSRKILGFHLDTRLHAKGSIKALKMALGTLDTDFDQNLIHHSDRGTQYCSYAYVKKLQKRSIQISMSENGDPLENAIAERVNGILKDEFLIGSCSNYPEAKKAVGRAIDIYNSQRLHSSINYLTPDIAHLMRGAIPRKWKNYYRRKEVEPSIS